MFTSTNADQLGSRRVVVSLLLLLFGGCTSTGLKSPQTSAIDARFQLSRWNARINISEGAREKSPGISFYQRVLSQTLGSHCSYFPSDSQYAQLTFRSCGPWKGIVRSMSRFYLEPDAAALGYPVILNGEHILFKDMRSSCEGF